MSDEVKAWRAILIGKPIPTNAHRNLPAGYKDYDATVIPDCVKLKIPPYQNGGSDWSFGYNSAVDYIKTELNRLRIPYEQEKT